MLTVCRQAAVLLGWLHVCVRPSDACVASAFMRGHKSSNHSAPSVIQTTQDVNPSSGRVGDPNAQPHEATRLSTVEHNLSLLTQTVSHLCEQHGCQLGDAVVPSAHAVASKLEQTAQDVDSLSSLWAQQREDLRQAQVASAELSKDQMQVRMQPP